jgi:Integrase zinc binding domain
MESETAYSLPSNSLLPLLEELQKGDALATEKSKELGQKGRAGAKSN